jgi:glyoxylase-like metal-dependent hydrolase (beta-lactamase superfamily II)
MVKLYAMTCGWLTMNLRAMLEGEQGIIKVPVPSYLVDHPEGKVLFDSGLHKTIQSDPAARLGGLAKAFEFFYERGEDIEARLAAFDVDAAEVRYLVASHLHFDHVGGNDAIPNAQFVVQKREWEAACDPDLAHANGFMAQDYDHGHDRLEADGEHDLFGDGTVVCLPTFGHTPGHQSLKVKTGTSEVVLTGDACYFRRTLENMHLPKVLYDRDQMRASLEALRALQLRGAQIFYGHDPEFWETVPQAPARIG